MNITRNDFRCQIQLTIFETEEYDTINYSFLSIFCCSDSDVPLAICTSHILLATSDTAALSVGCPPAPSSEERVKIINILSEQFLFPIFNIRYSI